jgi:MFS family permease
MVMAATTDTGSALRRSAGSTAGFAVAMGIGRFVYTPILPVMSVALAMPTSHGSWIAAANYLGYLLGSGMLTRRPDWTTATVLRVGLVATVVLLAGMPLVHALPWFLLLRLLAGVASAMVFVCLAHGVPELEERGGSAGLAFAGVGAGIALSGVAVGLAASAVSASWTLLWLVAAAGAALLTPVAWRVPVPAAEPRAGRAGRVPGHRRLSLSYLFEGIGYIIIGTYLVALVAESTGAQDATWVWVVAGLAAVPSPVLWAAVSRRVGLATALTGAYVLQILAAVLPVAVGGVAGGYLGAALFGATFMGITQMTMARARQLGIGAAAAGLTLVYALGQLLGPVIVAVLPTGGYGPAFLVAAVILGAATVLTVTGRN